MYPFVHLEGRVTESKKKNPINYCYMVILTGNLYPRFLSCRYSSVSGWQCPHPQGMKAHWFIGYENDIIRMPLPLASEDLNHYQFSNIGRMVFIAPVQIQRLVQCYGTYLWKRHIKAALVAQHLTKTLLYGFHLICHPSLCFCFHQNLA